MYIKRSVFFLPIKFHPLSFYLNNTIRINYIINRNKKFPSIYIFYSKGFCQK